MVRFHVMDYQIIRLAALQGLFQVPEPLLPFPGIGRIQDGYFPVQDYIGIVRHAFRDFVLALKQIQIFIIYAYVAYILCYFFHITLHISLQR